MRRISGWSDRCISVEPRLPVDLAAAAAAERLVALGAVMEEDRGKSYAVCAMTLPEPLPEAAVLAAAMCQGVTSETLSPREELEALRLLQRFVPKAQEVSLPSSADWRKCPG